MKKLIIACLILGFLLLTACSLFRPYQPDVQQGNILTEAMVSKLRVGMTKEQVTDLLGEPVLVNTFNQNHWAYVYTFQRDGGKIVKKSMDIYFSNNRVTRIVNEG